MNESELISLSIPERLSGSRLDQALAELLPDFSRSRLQQWIKAARVLVDGAARRPRDLVRGGEQVEIDAELEPQTEWRAQDLALEVLFEDEHILVVNKPPGMVVHPAAGNRDGTLVNALLFHDGELANIPRAGIVHRLDKDTSGLLVVARSLAAHKSLVDQLQARSVEREYLAVVVGVMTAGGRVDEPIGRHPVQRTRMAVVRSGKPAVTHYRVERRFRAHTAVAVKLETGRTHQIRVHMAHIHYPLLGDPVYGGRLRMPPAASPAFAQTLRDFKRQALHARRLALLHPRSHERMEWQVPPPKDMLVLLEALETDSAGPGEA